MRNRNLKGYGPEVLREKVFDSDPGFAVRGNYFPDNIAGKHNEDGTVTIFAITSTISANGDTGADPNKLVRVTDRVSDSTNKLAFTTDALSNAIAENVPHAGTAGFGEVLRCVPAGSPLRL